MAFDFTKVGGRPILPMGARTLAEVNPAHMAWNFGVIPEPMAKVKMRDTPSLHQKYPKLQGAWDGKTIINHVDAVLKNYAGDWGKVEELIHYQPRGTCGGRSGASTIDFCQHLQIASGKRAKFKRASHAAVYYFARKLYGWVGSGNWRNDGDDGVAGGSVPDALKKYGANHREEANDPKWYGAGSDDLACQLVCGMHTQLEAILEREARDNIVTDWVPVRSAQELADGIASRGVGIGSDSRGFTMTRNQYGFCSPSGTWHHYHTRVGVGTWGGRKGFVYWQSWSKDTPGGPKIPGLPGNCFLVDWDVQDQCCRNGEYAVVFSLPLWELEVTPPLPWYY